MRNTATQHLIIRSRRCAGKWGLPMFEQFNHPLVRDLVWVALAPPLLTPGILPVRDPLAGSVLRQDPEKLKHTLKQLETDPVELQRLVPESRDRRLGSYYERLWHALLTLAPDVRMLGRNITLYQHGITMGELDLLLEMPDGAVVHLELAIKFYVGQPEYAVAGKSFSPHSAWWGPDPRDQMASKIDRLLNHQLSLASKLELARERYPIPDLSCAWLQGQLFLPLDREMPPAVDSLAPATLNRWCRHAELNTLDGAEWIALPHKQWLMPPPLIGTGPAGIAHLKEMARFSAIENRPLMLVRRDVPEIYDPLTAQRLLCMPDHWPGELPVTL